jgi:hypothetical protein
MITGYRYYFSAVKLIILDSYYDSFVFPYGHFIYHKFSLRLRLLFTQTKVFLSVHCCMLRVTHPSLILCSYGVCRQERMLGDQREAQCSGAEVP